MLSIALPKAGASRSLIPTLSASTRYFSSGKKSGDGSDPGLERAELEFEKAREYARDKLLYKCGNITTESSRFNFLKRWHLERSLLNYNHQKHSMFLYAYREFIRALSSHDTKVLKKMTEPQLYQAIVDNQKQLQRLNTQYFCVQDDIKMKLRLLDVQLVQGIYIERKKNLRKELYSVDDLQSTADKVVFVRESKAHDSDFNQVFKERQVKSDQDVSFMQVEIQFTSNLRLGLEHKYASEKLQLGAPKEYTTEYETHFLRFERYVKMPLEMKLAKEKLLGDARESSEKAEQMKEEELVNPWLITDVDYSLDDNYFSEK